MLELRLTRASLLKKVLESIKDLVTNANFDCSAIGFSLQAMDSSHVALVCLLIRYDGFKHYRCDRNISMGTNLPNMAKMLRCASDDDIVTMKADDGGDTVTFMFESPSQDKISDYEMKLMDIDSEHLGIPEVEYQAIVRMPASEFAQICKDLSTMETLKEEATDIEMEEPISQNFSLRYLNAFTKATPLSVQVKISLSNDMPVVIEYTMQYMGYIRFYLAPKLEEEDEVTGALVQNVPEVATGTRDVKPKVERKPKMEIEIQDGCEVPKVETKPKVEKIEIDDESEPEVETKPKLEKFEIDDDSEPKVETKPKQEIEIDETKPQVEAEPEVEVMDVE